MKDLAPDIHRQRLVIEGIPKKPIDDKAIKDYLEKLSEQLDMKMLIEAITHLSGKYGWAGWIHWESSGAHFYAWDRPKIFFSVDIYTCKEFENKKAIDFTKKYFEASSIVHKSF